MATKQPLTAREEWRAHWPLVAATTAAMSLAALPTFTLGVMIAPIEQEFGWTRTQITSGPALVSMMGLLFATLAGTEIQAKMLNPRAVISGERLRFQISLDRCHLFDAETGLTMRV